MHTARFTRNVFSNGFAIVMLTLLLVVMVSPLFLVILNSFKTEAEYVTNGPLALPVSLNTESITLAWNRLDYPTKLGNSLFISLSASLLAIFISLLNAYAMGIGKVRGATWYLIFFIVAITLPGEALIYPQYYMFKSVGMYDTRFAVILILAALNSAFGTYLLTAVFKAFPRELIEAAMIDGAGHFKMLWRVVVPIALPSLSVLYVFFFIWTFNEFFLPLIFLVSNDKQTVPLAIALAKSEHGVVITLQSAASMLGIVPCIVFFILFQRTLTRGVTAGSIK